MHIIDFFGSLFSASEYFLLFFEPNMLARDFFTVFVDEPPLIIACPPLMWTDTLSSLFKELRGSFLTCFHLRFLLGFFLSCVFGISVSEVSGEVGLPRYLFACC